MNRTLRKALITTVAAVGLTASFGIASASASQPASPGCFGNVRAATIHEIQDGVHVQTIQDGLPGASAWGHEASNRAGDNGTINQLWRTDYANNTDVCVPA